MKHIAVTEKSFGSSKTMFEIDVDKCLMVTDDSMALIGIKRLEEIIHVVDTILENVAMKMTGLGEDEMDEAQENDAIKDVIVIESILALNLAVVSLMSSDAAEDRIGKESVDKMFSLSKKIIDIIREMCDLSPAVSVMDVEEYRKLMASRLMDELDKWEKKEEK